VTLKISISGVRGIVPDSLTPEVCLEFAKAFGTYLGGGKVVLGTDPRASSEFIKGIIFSGLLSSGCEVVDLGICPTPTVGIMIRELKAAGGMVITASHNPLPWNGLKFMREDGIFLNEKQAKKLIDIYENKKFIKGKPKTLCHNPSAIEIHIKKILKIVNAGSIRRKKLKVAVDSCNGAGSEISLRLLQKLGCKISAINCNVFGAFPHPPEPIAENLKELCQLVKNKKLDIGFAFDSDADRLAIVTNEGKAAGEELTLALATKFILSQFRNHSKSEKIVVANLSTTQAIDDIAQSHGATVLRTKVGEVHVAEELKDLNGLIGGEGNGGVIYPPIGFNRDALTAMAMVLNLLAKARKNITEVIAEIPSYYTIKKKVECFSQDEASDIIEEIIEKFRGKDLVLTEGVKVILPQGWVHVRPSNTEPVLRIIAESQDKKEANKLIQKVGL